MSRVRRLPIDPSRLLRPEDAESTDSTVVRIPPFPKRLNQGIEMSQNLSVPRTPENSTLPFPHPRSVPVHYNSSLVVDVFTLTQSSVTQRGFSPLSTLLRLGLMGRGTYTPGGD